MSPEPKSLYGELIDKLALFLCSFTLSQFLFPQKTQVAFFLLALSLISLLSYLEPGRLSRALLVLFSVLCVAFPPLTLYLPVVFYDILETKPSSLILLPVIPLILLPFRSGWMLLLILLPVVAVALRLKTHARGLIRQKEHNHRIQDRLRETQSTLSRLDQIRSEQQDTEVRLATMNERNRIARDIHDNVGHLLSSALLQTAALLSSYQDGRESAALVQLKQTLQEGLDRIRSSVHQLHDSPVDLETEIGKLLNSVTSCRCRQIVDLHGIPENQLRQCLLAVIREALSNVIRHSNASELNLSLKEHPAFYQLAISDNGTSEGIQEGEGLGLRSMSERVSLLGGRIHISHDDGFSLFITLPKEKPA